MEPIRAPDAVELPAEAFKDVLPKPVTLARPEGRMIGGAVTLDSRDVLAGPIRVADSKVDPESCTADLRISLIAK